MSRPIRLASLFLLVVLILGYQTNTLPFLGEVFSRSLVWKWLYRLLFAATIGLTIVVLWRDADVRRRTLPVITVCVLCVAPLLFHPIWTDWVAKSYLVSIGLCVCLTVLVVSSDTAFAIRLRALATTVNALLCLIDVMSSASLSSTPGRAAGLAINPNVAGVELVLGASLAWRHVNKPWRLSFIAVVCAAIFVTLSKSAIMVAGLIFIITIGTGLISKRNPLEVRPITPTIIVTTTLVAWIAGAFFLNPQFSQMTNITYDRLGKLKPAIESSLNDIETLHAKRTEPTINIVKETNDLDKRLTAEENVDSAAARSMLLKRAIIEYKAGPWQGLGMERAHELGPHNNFLLFALAFGPIGWLVPLGFLALLIQRNGKGQNLEFPIAAAALFLISHDVQLLPATEVLFAIGFAAIRSKTTQHVEKS